MADFSGGSMSSGGGSMAGMGADLGTLDEPVTETIMRDLRMVGNKMLCVLNPRKANMQTLKNWDLWGPLVLCLTLATLLSWFAPYEQKSLVFASVFVIVCCGATVVTVNALYPIVKACIRPHCYIPVWWGLYPPNEQAYREVYDIAFNDAIRYLVQAGHVDESKLELLRPVKIATLRGSMTAIGSEGNSLIHLLYTFFKDTVKTQLWKQAAGHVDSEELALGEPLFEPARSEGLVGRKRAR